METYVYKTIGTCTDSIQLSVEEGKITECGFSGGCVGNTQGISRLVAGMTLTDAAKLLRGIRCRNNTSCPDQLAKACAAILNKQA